ncbi:FG-GAP repeat domain-containing protein [Armatimonas sp.]|uniref:FG-GAP repeat domain-containing protein n=1 Tax=Armatimonas sp. TaxID=1872638 RepID=UPI003752D420
MKLLLHYLPLCLIALTAGTQQKNVAVVPPTQPSKLKFEKIVINARSDFEAAGAADINGDSKLDVVSGDTWYEAPRWTPHTFREIGVWGRGPDSSGYRASFAELPVDVNGDGKRDIVSSDYASAELFWHENNGSLTENWPRHSIAKPGSAETTVFAPLLGKDDKTSILPNCGGQVVWYELRAGQWIEHKVGNQGAGHGIGFGDVNRDSKCDLITPSGWWENLDARNDKWIWHAEFACKPGDLGISTPVYDFDGDGKNDIVFGSGHNFGLYWLHNLGGGKWEQLPIDLSASQFHTLVLVGDKVFTGKRYKAHDHDPGAEEPLGLYYYQFDKKKKTWQKFVIDSGTQTGTGLQIVVQDINRDRKLDIIAPGKSGLYLFLGK